MKRRLTESDYSYYTRRERRGERQRNAALGAAVVATVPVAAIMTANVPDRYIPLAAMGAGLAYVTSLVVGALSVENEEISIEGFERLDRRSSYGTEPIS